MDIAPQLSKLPNFTLNPQQQRIVAHDEGPLLVIAGPGSGKTRSLILRAMNLLLLNKAQPEQLVLCTYTEKAANEMQHRFMALAKQVGYTEDLSQLRIGTIHSICNRLITKYRHYTSLGNNYQQLDEFEQRFFIFQHLDKLVTRDTLTVFKEKWSQGSNWEIAKKLQEYFDKIIEELLDTTNMKQKGELFHRCLAHTYIAYKKCLIENNCVSFAALLKITYDLLHNPGIASEIIQGVRYVFVDEYQDTNHIQEQIVLKLASATHNICVIGDEDQALYRFRGATVRNILDFEETIAKQTAVTCTKITLTTNYRSHTEIVERYDRWMCSGIWQSKPDEPIFRTPKTIEVDSTKEYADYPAVISIHGIDAQNEAEQFADCVLFLKEQGIIEDYSDVALLLHSVQSDHSGPYRDALANRNIPAFCPRARAYFEQEEILLLIACFAFLFDYMGEEDNLLIAEQPFAEYIQERCLTTLDVYAASHALTITLQEMKAQIAQLLDNPEDSTLPNLADFFYRLLAIEPFVIFAQNERQLRNIVIFSKMLQTFQKFYGYKNDVANTIDIIRTTFFHPFLRLYENSGFNEYEDREQPFLRGHVQIMTIHQAKGLEFPIVVVGSLNEKRTGSHKIDRDLQTWYKRQAEPEARIPHFDMMRLYYVAFSRAEKLLILTDNKLKPSQVYFTEIQERLPTWPYIQHELLTIPSTKPKLPSVIKKRYSFTGHIQIYETCPRQYQYFREYEFQPAHAKEVFLGLLVHQTLEDIHKIALHDGVDTLNAQLIHARLEKVYKWLLCTYEQPLDEMAIKESTFVQVYNYVRQNRREMLSLVDTEVPISAEQDGYILTGRIDLLMQRDNCLELLDFKTGPRPKTDDLRLIDYERQLYLYASVLEKQYKLPPARLLLYWTEEEYKQDALMVFYYQPERAAQLARTFASIVDSIKAKDFLIKEVPAEHVCKGCDIQHICIKEGVVKPFTCKS